MTASSDGATPPPKEHLSPAIWVAGGILLAGALVVFWPSGPDAPSEPVPAKPSDSAKRNDGSSPMGGVPPRPVDEPLHGPGRAAASPRVHPAVRGMPGGLQEAAPPPEPPTFDSPEEARAWYERALEGARSELDFRRKALSRLDKLRDEIDASSDPQRARATYERRRKLVEENLARAEARVAELERKLAELGD